MFKTIKNAFKTPDVRKRILYTLLLVVIFRLGCYITVPGVNSIALEEAMGSNNGVAGLIDMISGGAFSRFSVFAMSISPYITASIVIQLLGMIIPSLERLTKEGGEEGRKKINRYTKILTLVLALIEAIGVFATYRSSGIFVNTEFSTAALVIISLVAGTSILMWLGDEITNKGIGTRMGKGKGNVERWVALVKPGRVMFEIGGVSEEVAREALRLAGSKLSVKTKFVKKETEVGGDVDENK